MLVSPRWWSADALWLCSSSAACEGSSPSPPPMSLQSVSTPSRFALGSTFTTGVVAISGGRAASCSSRLGSVLSGWAPRSGLCQPRFHHGSPTGLGPCFCWAGLFMVSSSSRTTRFAYFVMRLNHDLSCPRLSSWAAHHCPRNLPQVPHRRRLGQPLRKAHFVMYRTASLKPAMWLQILWARMSCPITTPILCSSEANESCAGYRMIRIGYAASLCRSSLDTLHLPFPSSRHTSFIPRYSTSPCRFRVLLYSMPYSSAEGILPDRVRMSSMKR